MHYRWSNKLSNNGTNTSIKIRRNRWCPNRECDYKILAARLYK